MAKSCFHGCDGTLASALKLWMLRVRTRGAKKPETLKAVEDSVRALSESAAQTQLNSMSAFVKVDKTAFSTQIQSYFSINSRT